MVTSLSPDQPGVARSLLGEEGRRHSILMRVVLVTLSNSSLTSRLNCSVREAFDGSRDLMLQRSQDWPFAAKVPEGEIEPCSKGNLIRGSGSNSLGKSWA